MNPNQITMKKLSAFDSNPTPLSTDLLVSISTGGDNQNIPVSALPVSTAALAALNEKVDKVDGKALSTNDYTTPEKTKLAAIATSGTVGQILKKTSNDAFETAWANQHYAEFIYNSDGAQEKNRYNNWQNLIDDIHAGQDGPVNITFEQEEELPAGTYNLDYITFSGIGEPLALAGFAITLPDGFNVTSWRNGQIRGALGVIYEGTDPLVSKSEGINLFRLGTGAAITCTDAPFFEISGTATFILGLEIGANLLNDGYEVIELDGTGFFILTADASTNMTNDVFRGDVSGMSFAAITLTSAASQIDPARTDANISSPIPVALAENSARVNYDPTASGLTAQNVQDAIDEVVASFPVGGTAWGAITGTITDQTDLVTLIDKKMTLIGSYSFGSDSINFIPTGNMDIDSYTAKNGDVLRVRTAGTKDFGGGDITLRVNDYLVYDGTLSQWVTLYRATEVNGQIGNVNLDYADVGADASGAAATAESNANDYTDSEISGINYPVDSVNGQTDTVVLDPDDLDDTATSHKFVTATDLTTLSNTSGTNTGDQDLSGYATIASLGALATLDEVTVAEIDATGTPDSTTFLRGDGTWATPAGGGGSGSELLDSAFRDSNTNDTASVTVPTYQAVDTTNLRVSFTVPASGKVLVRLHGAVYNGAGSGGPSIWWGLLNGSTLVASQVADNSPATSFIRQQTNTFIVSGLTPGASLDWDLAVSSSDHTLRPVQFRTSSAIPSLMEVWSL